MAFSADEERSGSSVGYIDKSRPGGGTTSATFTWINTNEKTPYDYFKLNYTGLKKHFRLRNEPPNGAPWLHPGSNLEWVEDEATWEKLPYRVERLRSWGYSTEWGKASQVNEILEPNVVPSARFLMTVRTPSSKDLSLTVVASRS